MATLDALPALLIIDCQTRQLEMLSAPMKKQVLEVANNLAAAFREHGHPVVWTKAGAPPAGRVDVLGPAELEGDDDELDEACQLVDTALRNRPRKALNALNCDLGDSLREQGINQLVLVGLTTGGAVESTARAAYDAGFTVCVVADGVADLDPRRHDRALVDSLPFVAEIGFSDEIERQIR